MSDSIQALRADTSIRPRHANGDFVERRTTPDRRASDTREGGRRLDDRLKRPCLVATASPATRTASLDTWSHLLDGGGSHDGEWGDTSEFPEW